MNPLPGVLGLAAVPFAGFLAAAATFALMATGARDELSDEAELLVFAGLSAAIAGVCVMLAAVTAPSAVRAWQEAGLRGSSAVAAVISASLLVIIVVVIVYFLFSGMLPQSAGSGGRRRAGLLAGWAGVYMIPAAIMLRVVAVPTAQTLPPGTPVSGEEVRAHLTSVTRVQRVLVSLSIIVTLATAGTVALLRLQTADGPFIISVVGDVAVTVASSDVASLAALYGFIYAAGLVFAYSPARLALDRKGRAVIDRAHPLPNSDDETFAATRQLRDELRLMLGVELKGRQSLESVAAILAPLLTGLVAPLLGS